MIFSTDFQKGPRTRGRKTCPAHAPGVAGLAVMFVVLAACEPYRVEYHRRPAFYEQAVETELPDEVVRRDGTRIVYGSRLPRKTEERLQQNRITSADAEPERYELRKESDDGTVTLSGFMPEHLLVHLITCLHNQEYELIYEQLLSEPTLREWERGGHSQEDFEAYLERNRRELIRSLTRIYLGIDRHETRIERRGDGVLDVSLRPRAAEGLKFRHVRMISEGFAIKLVMIR